MNVEPLTIDDARTLLHCTISSDCCHKSSDFFVALMEFLTMVIGTPMVSFVAGDVADIQL